MNPIDPARDRRPPSPHWMSQSRNSACFGRGIRWFLYSSGSIDWSVAMSLPLGLSAILLLILGPPLMTSGNVAETSTDLGSVRHHLGWLIAWMTGLILQIVMTQLVLSRRWGNASQVHDSSVDQGNGSRPIVTVTIGGVWTTVSQSSGGDASRRIVGLWSMILLALSAISIGSLILDTFSATSVDRFGLVVAWIFAVQCLWQFLPLPQSLGRSGWSIIVAWFTPAGSTVEDHVEDELSVMIGSDVRTQSLIGLNRMRWCVIGFAIVSLIVGILAIRASGLTAATGGRPAMVFAGVALLTVWLFASSRNEDLFAIQLSLTESGDLGRIGWRWSPLTFWQRVRNARIQRAATERLRATVIREHGEASDASKVDEILERMHRDGFDSLSTEEIELLQRVSSAIRREREREQ